MKKIHSDVLTDYSKIIFDQMSQYFEKNQPSVVVPIFSLTNCYIRCNVAFDQVSFDEMPCTGHKKLSTLARPLEVVYIK